MGVKDISGKLKSVSPEKTAKTSENGERLRNIKKILNNKSKIENSN